MATNYLQTFYSELIGKTNQLEEPHGIDHVTHAYIIALIIIRYYTNVVLIIRYYTNVVLTLQEYSIYN